MEFCVSDDLGSHPTPALTEKAFYVWVGIFGGPPRIIFTDQGGEFYSTSLEELWSSHGIKALHSPSQSPFTNPIERHNGIAKIFILKVKASHREFQKFVA